MTAMPSPHKKHFIVLDALRGVAAIMVVAFHVFEAHAASRFVQVINHGYLAVDFFFLLSGFVIGYAYDSRWSNMSIKQFFKIRLIRLQPMIIIGMIIGAALFYFQGGILWPAIPSVPIWKMLLIMVIGFTLLPVTPGMDIRGWQEMHPLNGPGWSLFFEYFANILYAMGVRKFPVWLLSIIVFIAAVALCYLAIAGPAGDVIGGWSLDPVQFRIGLTRVMFPFFAGLLLFRVARLKQIKHAFYLCSILLAATLAMPRIGGSTQLWANGVYDAAAIIIVFPAIIFLGAGGNITGRVTTAVCKFLGAISYPLYITHYPIIYVYTAWVSNNKPSAPQALPFALLSFAGSIILAYFYLKVYDEPVRRWLTKKMLQKI